MDPAAAERIFNFKTEAVQAIPEACQAYSYQEVTMFA